MKRFLSAVVCTCLLLCAPARAWAFELVLWTTEIHEDRLVVIDFLANAYSAMQDDVTVKVVSVNENDLAERMREARAAGNCPHLVGTGSELLVALAETECLANDEASRIIRLMGRERFYPGALQMLAAPGGDQWYAVPFHGWVQGIWYRADWFEKANLAPPQTWSDIIAAAKVFTNPSEGQYGILVGTSEDHYATQVFNQIAASNSAVMFKSDGRVVFDNERMVESLKFYAELAKCTPPGPQTWRARDYFLQGKLAMMFYSTFIMDDLALARVASNSLTSENFAELAGADFDPNLVQNVRMVPVVSRRESAGYGMVNGFGLGRGMSDAERAAVQDFLQYLYAPAQYVTWLHMAPGGMMPVLRDVAGSELFFNDPSGLFRRYGRDKIRDIIEGLANVRSFSMVDGKRQPAACLVYAEGVIPRMIDRVVSKGVSPQQSVAKAAKEICRIADSIHSQE